MPDLPKMRAAMQAYADRINDGDLEGLLALFAPDAVIEDPVGSPIKTGAVIRDWFVDTIAFQTRIDPVAPIRGSHGNEVALTFEVRFTPPGGERLLIRSMDVCTFNAAGKITKLRGFWGPDDLFPA